MDTASGPGVRLTSVRAIPQSIKIINQLICDAKIEQDISDLRLDCRNKSLHIKSFLVHYEQCLCRFFNTIAQRCEVLVNYIRICPFSM